MGNFYTNIVVRETDVDAVAASLEALGRNAYVAEDELCSVVYDDECENQDIKELERLATDLSKRLRCPALAFLNHDDDVLWYALVLDGRVADRYNSFPAFDDSGGDTPEGGDAARLCAAFDAADQVAPVADLLRRDHMEVGFEVGRHSALLELLGLPPDLATLGYNYVVQGDLQDSVPDAILRAVGNAPPFEETAPQPPAARAVDPAQAAARVAEAMDTHRHYAALAITEVDIPPRFAKLLGSGRVNGFTAFSRAQRYIAAKGLMSSAQPGMVQADDLLADLFGGERQVSVLAIPRLLIRALGIPPLSDADAAQLHQRDSALFRKYQHGMQRAVQDLMTDARAGNR